jgi:hypothetical protein
MEPQHLILFEQPAPFRDLLTVTGKMIASGGGLSPSNSNLAVTNSPSRLTPQT